MRFLHGSDLLLRHCKRFVFGVGDSLGFVVNERLHEAFVSFEASKDRLHVLGAFQVICHGLLFQGLDIHLFFSRLRSGVLFSHTGLLVF